MKFFFRKIVKNSRDILSEKYHNSRIKKLYKWIFVLYKLFYKIICKNESNRWIFRIFRKYNNRYFFRIDWKVTIGWQKVYFGNPLYLNHFIGKYQTVIGTPIFLLPVVILIAKVLGLNYVNQEKSYHYGRVNNGLFVMCR